MRGSPDRVCRKRKRIFIKNQSHVCGPIKPIAKTLAQWLLTRNNILRHDLSGGSRTMARMKEHDKLAKRLGMILTRFNTGERLHLPELASEFNVSERTLQRDLNSRLSYLPIEREGATYFINPKFLGRQSAKDVLALFSGMGLEPLFPCKKVLFNGVLNSSAIPPFLFKNMKIEDSSGYTMAFQQLTEAIQLNIVISFKYQDELYIDVLPYRLVNDNGTWYLATTYKDKLTSFTLSKINGVALMDRKFKQKPEYINEIVRQCMPWLGMEYIHVIVQVDASISANFINSEIFPKQRIIKQLDDASLLISSQVNSSKQILPLLKFWMPHIDVLSPDHIKHELIRDLQASLERIKI